MNTYQIADILMHIDNDVWDECGFDSRPTGDDRVTYMNSILDALENTDEVYPEDVTPDVIDALEAENYHSLIDALSVFTDECDLEDVLD